MSAHMRKDLLNLMLLFIICSNSFMYIKSTSFGHSSERCIEAIHIDIPVECSSSGEKEMKHDIAPNCTSKDVRPYPTCIEILNISVINLNPFSDKLIPYFFLQKVLPKCCGKCVKFNFINPISSLMEFNEVNSELPTETLSMIYPLFGYENSETVYGYHFIPLFGLKHVVYISQNREVGDMVTDLLAGIFSLWPLLLVCLLMAAIAGFIEWALETWKNEGEFRRPFHQGFFDGFWWGFVSMTTVGYGDKSPQTLSGRTFSIVWILCGITICSMFTGALTNVISASVNPPAQDLSGERIGTLDGRFFSLNYAVAKGGKPYIGNSVAELLSKLKNEEIDGMLPIGEMGKVVMKIAIDIINSGILLDEYTAAVNVTLKDYTVTKFEVDESNVASYGIGFTQYRDYKFFKEVVKDNKIILEICLMLGLNDHDKSTQTTNIFSVEGGLFYPVLCTCLVTMVIIFIYGFIFEYRRRKKGSVEEKGVEEIQENQNTMHVNQGFQGRFTANKEKENESLRTNFSAS